eukprot:Lankesteria_metandrocarpae@DN3773_c0_g1_i1.p1
MLPVVSFLLFVLLVAQLSVQVNVSPEEDDFQYFRGKRGLFVDNISAGVRPGSSLRLEGDLKSAGKRSRTLSNSISKLQDVVLKISTDGKMTWGKTNRKEGKQNSFFDSSVRRPSVPLYIPTDGTDLQQLWEAGVQNLIEGYDDDTRYQGIISVDSFNNLPEPCVEQTYYVYSVNFVPHDRILKMGVDDRVTNTTFAISFIASEKETRPLGYLGAELLGFKHGVRKIFTPNEIADLKHNYDLCLKNRQVQQKM